MDEKKPYQSSATRLHQANVDRAAELQRREKTLKIGSNSQRSTDSSFQDKKFNNLEAIEKLKLKSKAKTKPNLKKKNVRVNSRSISGGMSFKSISLDRKMDIHHTLRGISNFTSYIPRTTNKNTKYKTDFYKNKSKNQHLKKGNPYKKFSNIYKCKGCQHPLFKYEDIRFHQSEKEEKKLCRSYFIEKCEWIHCDAINSIFKINCPKCKAVIGEARVAGLMCSCGNLQSPAFKIFKDKIKKIDIKS